MKTLWRPLIVVQRPSTRISFNLVQRGRATALPPVVFLLNVSEPYRACHSLQSTDYLFDLHGHPWPTLAMPVFGLRWVYKIPSVHSKHMVSPAKRLHFWTPYALNVRVSLEGSFTSLLSMLPKSVHDSRAQDELGHTLKTRNRAVSTNAPFTTDLP